MEQRKAGLQSDVFFYEDKGGAVQFQDICDVWFASSYPLAEVILEGQYDLLHITAAALPRAEKNMRQARYDGAVVITSHGWFPEKVTHRHVVGVSQFGANEIQSRCPAPVKVIYNGLDLSKFHPADGKPDGKPIAAWVGRATDPQKQPVGLSAFGASELASRFRIVAVDGDAEDSGLEDWLPQGSQVIRRLPRHKMPEFYRSVAASGGFLLSTARVEWCPMNILEAQACGCPVIAPAVGGIPEIVGHQQTGYVYDKGSGLDGLHRALDWLYSNGHYESARQSAAEYAAKRFSSERMHREYLAVYQDSLSEVQRSAARALTRPLLLAGVKLGRRTRDVLRGRPGL
jgi:glycosyltransferase involved in cell wall biosynthesis